MKITIINGPNLNLLGQRETGIYGRESFESYLDKLRRSFSDVEIEYFQSNHEGALIDKIHEVGFDSEGIVLNAGALSHTSLALADAVASVPARTIEVHISNVYSREEYRHHSFLSARCKGLIVGLGLKGYKLAVQSLVWAE
jgi:3-dehydroquinate dehydratase-2